MEYLEFEKLVDCWDLDVSHTYFMGSIERTFSFIFSFGGSYSTKGNCFIRQ